MSLVRRPAKNHPQQVAARGADDATDDRRFPAAQFAPLMAEFRFTTDAAASAENALCPRFFTRETNGLAQTWAGERVWCNPPYSNVRPWVEKAWAEYAAGCPLIVMLLPANRTEQGWWQDLIEPFRRSGHIEARFLPGRIRFDRPGWQKPAKGDRPPFGLVLLIWERPAPRPTDHGGEG